MLLDKASGLFVERASTRPSIPLLEKILAADPHNLDATLRLATAHSALGPRGSGDDGFQAGGRDRAASPDVNVYLALHYARGQEWERAVPLLERMVGGNAGAAAAVEALAAIRERQGRERRRGGAAAEDLHAADAATGAELRALGELAMEAGQTAVATEAFERARAPRGAPSSTISSSACSIWPRGRSAGRQGRARPRPFVQPGLSDGALQARAGQRAAARAGPRARIAAARQHADATTRPLIDASGCSSSKHV